MDKSKLITTISILLNNSTEDITDTNLFTNKRHDASIEDLRQYMIRNAEYLNGGQIEPTQALNDHGVDLIFQISGIVKIGFQIKSHFDVKEKDFASKVKRQMTESLYHGLDKWYLLICSPLKNGTEDYAEKISHLINELSGLKTSYHCVFGPQSIVGLFKNNSKFDNVKFNLAMNMYSYETPNNDEIVKELSRGVSASLLDNIKPDKSESYKTASLFLAHLKKEKFEIKPDLFLKELNIFYNLLVKLPSKARELYYLIVLHCGDIGDFGNNSSAVYTPYLTIFDILGINKAEFSQRINQLQSYDLVNIDEDDLHYHGQLLIRINSFSAVDDLIMPYELKRFLQGDKEKLNQLFVGLNFQMVDL